PEQGDRLSDDLVRRVAVEALGPLLPAHDLPSRSLAMIASWAHRRIALARRDSLKPDELLCRRVGRLSPIRSSFPQRGMRQAPGSRRARQVLRPWVRPQLVMAS